ncbi:competence type IV pilus minor pilin ComGF [Streptococcus sp. DD13]|uniref:competence type IV pilus minor pilin ComGF n=1 Tax=Streptococcus sp. DD13 TaxID=1777881 RepID=UPI000793F2A3|nr:competence type IV pilus minor pilin ComGF [Streptococcus sp. DD13]KXT77910.1 Late competence protein ComGF, access of DNA to ComEA [Streptococcus sp. DD13]
MFLKNKEVPAFTLLECLVALFVMSGSLLVFQGLTSLVHQEVQYLSTNVQKDWSLFVDQFRTELDGVVLEKVEQNRLLVRKRKQQLAFALSGAGDFRKTDHKGKGYQPMLYGLSTVRVREKNGLVHFQFTFENGVIKEFAYAFQKAS